MTSPTTPTTTTRSAGNQSDPTATNDGGGADDGDNETAEHKASRAGGSTQTDKSKATTRRPSADELGLADYRLDGSARRTASSGRKRVGVVVVDTAGRRRRRRRAKSEAGAGRARRSIKLSDLQQDQGQQARPFASSNSRIRLPAALLSGGQKQPQQQQQQQHQRRPQPSFLGGQPAATAEAYRGPAAGALPPLGRPGGGATPPQGPQVSINSYQNPMLGLGLTTHPPPPSAASATTAQSAGGGHQLGQPSGPPSSVNPFGMQQQPPAPELDFELTERQERELQENLTNWLAVMYNRDPPLTRSLGHQFDDMILRCTMKSINCTHQRSFENSFTPTEGNCFTYRSKIRRRTSQTPLGSSSSSGLLTLSAGSARLGGTSANSASSAFEEANLAGTNHGLELVLNLEKNEYISGSSQVGALVMIHHPSDLGYAASEATFVAPEFTTYIGLKMVNLTRLPAPYPEYCVDSWPGKFADTLTRNSTYSQQACLKICLQKTIQSHCQCQSAFLPIVELESNQFHTSGTVNTDPAASNSSAPRETTEPPVQQQQQQQRIIICDTRKLATRQCVRDVMFRAADRVHNCECPPKCQVVRYDKTISMARWPTREDKVSFDRGKMDVNFQNLAKVIVYFQTMTCDEITQQAVFNAAKLFSALGGIMGMYVGFSFLSVFEIFEVMSRKMWHHFMVRLSRASLSLSGVGAGRFRG